MVSALVPGASVRVRALAGDTVLFSWARHLTLAVPLSTPLHNCWGKPNKLRGNDLRWTSIPQKYSQPLHTTETGDKLRQLMSQSTSRLKKSVDCMTEKLNILKRSRYYSAMSRQLVLKWDHFDILGKGRSDTHCKIKETLLIRESVETHPK